MRLLGKLFSMTTANKPDLSRTQHARNRARGARGMPGGKPNALPALPFATPALWVPEDGANVLDEIVIASGRAVVMTDDDAATCALFALHAHCLDAAKISPLLAITAPAHGSGKTTLLRVMAALVPLPLFVSARQLKRRQVIAFFQKLPACLVGIEACASSRY